MHREADKVVQGKNGAEEQVQIRPPGKWLWRAVCRPDIEDDKQEAGCKLQRLHGGLHF